MPIHIHKLIIRKKKAKNRAKKTKNPKDKNKFNILNSIVKQEISSLYSKNWSDFIDNLNKSSISSKPFWDKINMFRNGKKSNSTIPTIVDNNISYKSDSEKANLFGSRLENIFSDANDSRFDNLFKSKVENEVVNYLSRTNIKFNNQPYITIDDLNKAIKSLNNKSSPGPDSITNKHLKNLSEGFKKIVLDLFNETIKQGKTPTQWKESIVTMIPKKSTKSDNPKDYRPISLTSCLAKLCEKVILSKLTDFLNSNNIIIKQQSGFRKGRQTKDNIVTLIQKTVESFNRQKQSIGFFFDIAAAFDRVWRNGLIFKMIKLNIPPFIIYWIKNFLENRTFCVKVNDSFSDKKVSTAGVPQGAILSPTLFSIFINDIPKCEYRNKSNSLLFADDLATFFIFRKINNKLRKNINNFLSSIESWLCNWILLMSPSKCNYIIFNKTKNSKTIKTNEFKPELFKENIPESDCITFLGIRFDNKFNFQNQVNYLVDNCAKRLSIIKILSNKNWKIKTDILLKIYILLIRSLLDYSSLIYHCLNSENKKKLQLIQNNSLRIILHKPLHTPITDLHRLAKLDTIESRFNKLNRKFILKNLVNKNPLVCELIYEFLNYSAARVIKYATPLCFIKPEIITFLNSLNPP